MRPHPKIRKTIKWGGAVLALLVLGALAVSVKKRVGFERIAGAEQYVVEAHSGIIAFQHFHYNFPPPASSRWVCEPSTWPFRWWFRSQWMGNQGVTFRFFGIPMWLLLIMPCLCCAAAWRLDVIARRTGCCSNCGYNRAGIAAGAVCPECGAEPKKKD